MGAFSSLEIGKRALLAQRFGLDVTSNNIANVNTPGYSRRAANLSETSPRFDSGSFLGTGVLVDNLRTFREEFFDKEIRTNISRESAYEADEKVIQRVETIINEPSDLGINELVTKFFNSWEQLSIKPSDPGLRNHVLSSSQNLIDRFNIMHSQLSDARTDVFYELNTSVNEANKLIEKISSLNVDINTARAKAGSDAQTLIDQRELHLEELAKLSGITVAHNDNGSVNVFINGIDIISGPVFNKMKLVENLNSVTGERTLELVKVDKKDNIINKLRPDSGTMVSNLKHYNVLLDEQDTSGGFSAIKDLNAFADSFVQRINEILQEGFGLNDPGPNSPARAFFEPAIGQVTAGNIRLSDDVKGKPENIPVSDSQGEGGNNKLALTITRLQTDPSFLNGANPAEYYSAFLTNIGAIGFEAKNGKNTTSLVTEQLNNQRESVIGVNLDEEAINLIKFQKAFEASSRLINTTNEILTTLINLGR